jgi:putative hydrolase of the HAD superfamily
VVTPGAAHEQVRAILIDLDDTLYPQSDFLRGAVRYVGERAETLGLDRERFEQSFQTVLARGSDTGHTIDTALEEFGCAKDEVLRLKSPLVSAFLGFRPVTLECYDQVPESLRKLGERAALVCLTDGQPDLQRAKLDALGIASLFKAIVITDELGGRLFRKPATACLHRISEMLDVPVRNFFVLGDRLDKDVALARFADIGVIRIRQGEYDHIPSPPDVTTVSDFPTATKYLLDNFF